MKTKQTKEEQDRSIEEESTPDTNAKTRARKKGLLTTDEERNKLNQESETKGGTSKETVPKKKVGPKPAAAKAIVKKRPLGVQKTLRSKKVLILKDKLKKVIKQGAKRGRKCLKKAPEESSLPKEIVPIIPASEIKKEPLDETLNNTSRSSSPKTGGRRQRLSSDVLMMKSVLGESPTNFLLSARSSPYSMRSERSSSPSVNDGKNLRSGRRKLKNNLLNEIVKNEQKKRRRLLSESKLGDSVEGSDDLKKLKRGRSCSRDGSEISKCSDLTESDLSLCDNLSNDADCKPELVKKPDKSLKTDLDVDNEEASLQVQTDSEKVPSITTDSKLFDDKPEIEKSCILTNKCKNDISVRSTSLDSDNNNDKSRMKLADIQNNASDVEDKTKFLCKTDANPLVTARSSLLDNMSKTFNTKDMTKNIRKARRGRKVAAGITRPKKPVTKVPPVPPTEIETMESGKDDTIETITKDISDLIYSLDCDTTTETAANVNPVVLTATTEAFASTDNSTNIKSATKFYSLADAPPVVEGPETPKKLTETEVVMPAPVTHDVLKTSQLDKTPKKLDEGENIRLHFDEDEDSVDKHGESVKENVKTIVYSTSTVQDIDKLMDKLKHFEELDKKRQQELKAKSTEKHPVMVTNDVVLIPKSGADIKPLKDIQAKLSPERLLEKENFMSCFENNSAISILKRDHARKSIDVDLPNSVTLIKRNSIPSRKESTGSNNSRESSDPISISLGKDVTLTEIRKSIEKPAISVEAAVQQFSILHQCNPAATTQSLPSMTIDPQKVSITKESRLFTEPSPRIQTNGSDVQKSIRRSRDSINRKSSESTSEDISDKATLERIKSPPLPINHIKTPEAVKSPPPVSVKSPEFVQSASVEPVLTPSSDPESASLPEVEKSTTDGSQIMLKDGKNSEAPNAALAVLKPETVPKLMTLSAVVNTHADLQLVMTDKSIGNPEAVGLTPTEIKLTQTEVMKPLPQPIGLIIVKTPLPMNIIASPALCSKSPPTQTATSAEENKQVATAVLTKLLIDAPIISPITIKSPDTEKSPVKPEAKPNKPMIDIAPGPSGYFCETPESQKHKENILRTLGLLTHKAAKEAKIDRQKQKEKIMANKVNKSKMSTGDYTGTLKTVIKLNRGSVDKKKCRSSLKMTFQKKNRAGKPSMETGDAGSESDDSYYTIHKEGGAGATAPEPQAEVEPEPPAKETTLNLVIPEKASSFSIHPGRLCQDQCFYCGGKFGLFDTPCHIAQMKSAERQKKVLDNEEKLTIDSCLCDACYRHVDRRANCPSYRKRPNFINKPPITDLGFANPDGQGPRLPVQKGPGMMEDDTDAEEKPAPTGRPSKCHTEGCTTIADHSIRRKWLIKMRNSVNRVLKLQLDYPGLHTIPLCAEHYRTISPLMTCALCRRRVTKNHNIHFIHQGYLDMNPLLAAQGIPVAFTERPIVCKMCRYYCSLLQRPDHNQRHFKAYRRRLLQMYNLPVPEESDNEGHESNSLEEDNSNGIKQKRKNKTGKSKQRKSTETNKTGEDGNMDKPGKDTNGENADRTQNIEEDIESLISLNKILVPGARSGDPSNHESDSDAETIVDFDSPLLPFDKQSELQYLLQRQNNPSQFMQQPLANLTQKQKNVLKAHNASAIQKPGQVHKVVDKNAKRIQKLGQIIMQKDGNKNPKTEDESAVEMTDATRANNSVSILKNISLNEECTIESIPTKKPADINTLKNKWQMSESFSQVKKNLSELSRNLTVEKPSRKSSDKYSNPVKRLETNPSISVRELFPGEEEMNLHYNIEFNNVKGVTPEGWEKCSTTVQYDVETKKLWNELQKPYGNQSSFMRHLVLLEKYFRSGELVLAQNANANAVNYSDSVQSRLRAYDNIPGDTHKNEPAVSLIGYRRQKTSSSGKSLLKNNQNNADVLKSISEGNVTVTAVKSPEPPPQKQKLSPYPIAPVFAKPRPGKAGPPNMVVEPRNPSNKVKSSLPPELIAINTPSNQGRKSIENVLKNIQQLVKGVSAPDPTEVASSPIPPPPTMPKLDPPPKRQKTTTKPWRPTLMPITQENLALIAREPPQVAVDGRTLPSLVQVMSSGNRYHITIADYNKMCIMRREKLQQLNDGDSTQPKTKRSAQTELVTEIHPSATHGNGGTMTQNLCDKTHAESNRSSNAELKNDMMNDFSRVENNAQTLLKNVGLKNITIAPIPAAVTKTTATVTSQTVASPVVSTPSLLISSTPIKIPQFGPAVTITSETFQAPNIAVTASQILPSLGTTIMPTTSQPMPMPKIPRSLTVIPQTVPLPPSVVSVPQFPAGADGPRP